MAKKILCILIITTMMVSMVPDMQSLKAYASDDADITESTVSLSDTPSEGFGWKWYTDGITVDDIHYAGHVLVLDNLNLLCKTDTMGIHITGNATVVTKKDSINDIVTAYNKNSDAFGIYCNGDILFEGKGTLNISASADGDNTAYGIYSTGKVTINSGTVNSSGLTYSGVSDESDKVSITFDSSGGTVVTPIEIDKGTSLNPVPATQKDGYIFTGWIDKDNLKVYDDTIFDMNSELSATYEQISGNELLYNDTVFTRTGISKDATFIINAPGYTTEQVKEQITLSVLDNSGEVQLNVEKQSGKFIVSATGGFTQGGAYRMQLKEGLFFDGQDEIVRSCEFTIAREEVFNIHFNENMGFVDMSDLSDMSQNGDSVDSLRISLFSITDESEKITKDTGTFKLKAGTLKIGDVVCIHSNKKPVTGDDKDYLDDDIAYVKITDIKDGVYHYESAQPEEVLLMPDVLPVSNNADTDGDASNFSITVIASVFDYSSSIYESLGLSSATTVDKGDFLSFYSGVYGSDAVFLGYGKITSVSFNGNIYVVGYTAATQKDLDDAMEYYSENAIDPEKLIQNIDVEQLERDIEAQAMESGFAEQAAWYLLNTAIQTDGFKQMTAGYDAGSLYVKTDNNQKISLAGISTMAIKPAITGLKVKAQIGTKTDHFGSGGLQCKLDISFSLAVVNEENKGVNITVSATFVEELKLSVNASGKAIWKKAWIFPYIADYQFNANLDVYNYTYIKIDASVSSKDGLYTDVNISHQIKDILDMTSKDQIKSGMSELFDLYKDLMDTDSDWIEIFEKEISKIDMRLLLGIIHIRVTTSFVISVDMKVALGMEFEYISGDRYCFWLKIKAKDAGSETIRLIDQKSTFQFYVIGTIGIRAGIRIEIAVGLFSVDLASVGLGAETGAYIRLYGFFHYKTESVNNKVVSSTKGGMLYIETGVYLELFFKAQALGGKYQYSPQLFYKEWPILTSGNRYGIFDFTASDGLENAKMKKSVKCFDLPENYLMLSQVDLKLGDVSQSTNAYTSTNLEISISNPAFSYDGNGRIHVNPGAGKHIETGTITIRYKNSSLGFSSLPIERVLNVQWDDLEDFYYITFTEGAMYSIKAPYGTPLTAPDDPKKAGYTFEGWYKDYSLKQQYTFTTMSNENIFLFAKWKPDTVSYTVEHYLESLKGANPVLAEQIKLTGLTDSKITPEIKTYAGFISPESKQVTIKGDGTTIVRYDYKRETYTLTFQSNIPGQADIVSKKAYQQDITAPVMAREGYTFTGWNEPVPDTMPARNATYIAQWTVNSYDIEYFIDNVKDESESKKYVYGQSLYNPVMQSGYRFSGWFTDEACKLPFSSTTMPARNIKLFGKIIARNDITYTTKHYIQNLDETDCTLKQTDILYGTTNSNVDAVSKNFEGFTYDESITGTVKSGMVKGDGSLELSLYYTRNKYLNKYILDNKGVTTDKTDEFKYEQDISDKIYNPETITGYHFEGWKTDDTYATAFTFPDKMPAHDITVYGRYLPNTDTQYKVEHYLQNIDDENYQSTPYATDNLTGTTDTTVYPNVKEITGFTAPTKQSLVISPDGSAVLMYYYTRNTYTITFEVDDITDTAKEGQPGPITAKFEKSLGIEPVMVAQESQGYDFAYWYDIDAGENVIFDFTTMPAKDVTLNIKWYPRGDTPYTVIHRFENVEGEYIVDANKTQNLKGITATAADPSVLNISGYVSPTKDISTLIHRRGTTVITYDYARVAYTITYDTAGGTGVTDGTLKWGSALPIPQKAGYIFLNWYKVSEPSAYVLSMPEANTAVFAKWKLDPDYTGTIDFDLWVGGIRVTNKNRNNITEGVSYASGTANYNPDDNTLYLNEFRLDMADTGYPTASGAQKDIGIYYAGSANEFTVNLRGDNRIGAIDLVYGYISRDIIGIKTETSDLRFDTYYYADKGDLVIKAHTGLSISKKLTVTSAKTVVSIDTSTSNKSDVAGVHYFKNEGGEVSVHVHGGGTFNINAFNNGKTAGYAFRRAGTQTIKIAGDMSLYKLEFNGYRLFDTAGRFYTSIILVNVDTGNTKQMKIGTNKADASEWPTDFNSNIDGTNFQYLSAEQKKIGTTLIPLDIPTRQASKILVCSTALTGGIMPRGVDSSGNGYAIYSVDDIAITGGNVTLIGSKQAVNKALTLTGYEYCLAQASSDIQGTDKSEYHSDFYDTYRYITVQRRSEYGITLSQTNTHTFTEAVEDYPDQTPLEVTITNTGNMPTGTLNIALSGTNSDSFTLSKESITSIDASGTYTFTVVPKTGLSVGTYTATVTVTGNHSISASFTVSFTVKPVPSYGISLSKTGTHVFTDAEAGYSDQTPLEVTITNTGNMPTGTLNIALSGTNSDSFTLNKESITDINTSATDKFTVVPKTGLSVGTYTDTLTVTGENGISASFIVSFTVKPVPSYGVSLSETGTYVFTEAVSGYGEQDVLFVYVENDGSMPTGDLNIALFGSDPEAFILSRDSINSISVSGTNSFIIVPESGLSIGTYTATVTVTGDNSISASFVVSFTVISADISVSGISLNTYSLNLYSNSSPNSATLVATVLPSNATDKSVIWSSSDTSVVNVDANGRIDAKSTGSAIIYATTNDGHFISQCTVTITEYIESSYDDDYDSYSDSDNEPDSHIRVESSGATVTRVVITIVPKVDKDGNLNVDLFMSDVLSALNVITGNKPFVLVIEIADDEDMSGFVLNISKYVQDMLVNGNVTALSIISALNGLVLEFDKLALTSMANQTGSSIMLQVQYLQNVDTNNQLGFTVGDRPVFEFTVFDATGNPIDNFGTGNVEVCVYYELRQNEKAENVYAVYIDRSGVAHRIYSSSYDEKTCMLCFTINHFSTYAVAYKSESVEYSDTVNHWASSYISEITSFGLMNGVENGIFSPDSLMTKQMVITVLGRLAGVQQDMYATDEFVDLSSSSYSYGYMAWAVKHNIIGVSENGYVYPDAPLSREQLVVILDRYAQATGFKWPEIYEKIDFVDEKDISSSAKESIDKLTMSGILNGKPDNIFDPSGTTTRAEVCAVLYRFIKLVEGDDLRSGWLLNGKGRWMYFKDGKAASGKTVISEITYMFSLKGEILIAPPKMKYMLHTVKKGDSLRVIAKQYDICIEQLEKLNNISRYAILEQGYELKVFIPGN